MMGFSHHPFFWGLALAFLGGVAVTELNKVMEKDEHNANDDKAWKWVKRWASVIAAALLFWIIAGVMFHKDKFLAKSHLDAPAALLGLLAGYYWRKLAHLAEEATFFWKAVLAIAVLSVLGYVVSLLLPDSFWTSLQATASNAGTGGINSDQADAWTVITGGLFLLIAVAVWLVLYLLRGGGSAKQESKPKAQSGGGGHH
jgi:hypothetical protein